MAKLGCQQQLVDECKLKDTRWQEVDSEAKHIIGVDKSDVVFEAKSGKRAISPGVHAE